MARQIEGFLVGTYDDMTFYKMEGKYYARKKSSLTGTKYRTHKSFEGSRRSNGRFGMGNKIASQVYREIPEQEREYELFCKMKSASIAMIKAGKEESDVIEGLRVLKPLIKLKKPYSKNKIRSSPTFDNCLFCGIPLSANAGRKRKHSLNQCRIKNQSIKRTIVYKALYNERSDMVTEALKKQKKRQIRTPN
ncbi:MAG TPA: hypothetical protein VGD26_09815 [Chitinophagaceae bacterium]